MAGLHNIRKRASHAKQTKKTVTKGMSNSYITEKKTLETGVTKLRKALKELEQDRIASHEALRAERSICGTLASSVEDTDAGKVLTAGVAKLDLISDNLAKVKDESFKENVEKVTKQVSEMEAVLKTMREVEGLLAERRRYETKVEKLVKRGQKEKAEKVEKAEKRNGKVERNVEKLKKARESFENGEKEVVEKAREVNQEFASAVECLAKAFWGRRNGLLKVIQEGSKELRMWAVGEEVKEEVKEEMKEGMEEEA